jgi:hypothetical protein
MATQKHMGKNQLIDRLAAQVGSREMAIGILQKRGHLKPGTETLTEAGKKRDAMTAEDRAKARAAKRNGAQPSAFSYNPRTNRATKKR